MTAGTDSMSAGGEERADRQDSDRAKIERGMPVPCRICERVCHRQRLALRYCACCEQAFCEEEHGGSALGGRGSCIECSRHA